MRILLLNDDALPEARGGAAVIVDNLRHEFVKQGHEVLFVAATRDPNTKDVDMSEDDAGKIIRHKIIVPHREEHRRSVGRSPIADALQKTITEWKPDVMHAHNVHISLGYDTLRVSSDANCKTILTAHDTFLISFARIRSERYRRAVLNNKSFTMRWWEHVQDVGRAYSPLRNGKIRQILKSHVDKIVTLSHATEHLLHDHGIKNTILIPNGVQISENDISDADVAAFKQRFKLGSKVVLLAGRLSLDKGVGALLATARDVIAKIPDCTFLLAGERERIEDILQGLPSDVASHVVVTGWLPRNEMKIAMHTADVVTTPSIYLDNFPTTNLEAMLAKKPVVGTCFGGTPDVVVHEKTGFIVNPLDQHSFSDALIALLEDPIRALQMGQAGFDRVRDQFSLTKQASNYLALYQQ